MNEYTYLKRVKMGVEKLKIGMYVGKLDKDWKDSPFLFQGFPIEDQQQLELLREECREVTVDFKTQEEYKNYLMGAGDVVELEGEVQHADMQLLEELPQALKSFDESAKTLKILMRQVMQGNPIDLQRVEKSVAECINSLERYPEALLLAINNKNGIHYTAEHSMRVSVIAIAFGLELGMSQEQVRVLGLSAMLHDIGKAMIPHKIINKVGKLDKDETQIIKSHPKESFRLLSKIEGLSEVVKEVALSHHEREDGKGYPRHIPKDRVSRYAKLVSIIDAYDAIVSDRPYNKAREPSHAFRILNHGKGKKFDPDLVEHFVEWLGIYPVGSLVEMVTGELAIVLKKHSKKSMSPRVMIVTDENKKTGYEKVIDLSLMEMHSNGKPYKIKSILVSNAHGINIRRYLGHEKFNVPRWCENVEVEKDSPFSKYL